MTVNPKLKPVLYGLGVFAVYIIILVILRLISGRLPENPAIFGFFTGNDFLLGLLVAVTLTFTYVRRKKMDN
ncbi:hypothetical protein LJB95_01800 [Paludibacteraceae bacterium OttesenSCG-928-F17]|nr:hypothetical protein [Paludibacteraceae bacterium OttesenSCG-928-F17]